MNSIQELYQSNEQWNSLAIQFLEGSNQLADSPLEQIDFKDPENQKFGKGYYGALTDAVSAGIDQKQLTPEMLLKWKSQIQEEMIAHEAIEEKKIQSKPTEEKIQIVINNIKQKLSEVEKNPNDAKVVALLADTCFTLESEKLFSPVHRQLAHLIMNYLISYFKGPLIVFNKDDKSSYLSSLNDKLKMRIFLSEKVREFVFSDGMLLHKVGSNYANEWYQSDSKKKLSVEWHDLFSAVENWKARLNKKS